MKRIIFLLLAITLGAGVLQAEPPKKPRLIVQYKTINIEKGYDHVSRLKVYVDGNLTSTSEPRKESKPGKLIVPMESGSHSVKVVMESNYQNNWEEHTIANGYSIDCKYEGTLDFSKDVVLKLVFDINSGTIVR